MGFGNIGPIVPRAGRRTALRVVILLSLVLILALPAPWLTTEKYSNYALSVQAIGVLATLGIAVATLRDDSRDRRVDRVLALHQELTSGETGAARVRLVQHLKEHGKNSRVLQVTTAQLRDRASKLSRYKDSSVNETPGDDVGLLLRFFERAWLAQATGSLEDSMSASLIGAHAGWWDRAIRPSSSHSRAALAALSAWANTFAEDHASESQFINWGKTRQRDFPRVDQEPVDAE